MQLLLLDCCVCKGGTGAKTVWCKKELKGGLALTANVWCVCVRALRIQPQRCRSWFMIRTPLSLGGIARDLAKSTSVICGTPLLHLSGLVNEFSLTWHMHTMQAHAPTMCQRNHVSPDEVAPDLFCFRQKMLLPARASEGLSVALRPERHHRR